MTEENNGIFLAGSGGLVYLTEPMHKIYFTTFVWGHPFSAYVCVRACVRACVCVCMCMYECV